ncbi:OmpP1/FadL family transporter [Pseudomonas yamanorum]|uniref:OmpP1/FadL family transporter n=1 Tax=Pseudomonas yamanorum TaxID=515393 RepID=UPI001C47CB4E|nr:outer membrane protein transport protein [Pseudomonas yamanorum]MBV6659735.1 OmpP1/FadL family transporter [Pseudomonas yamanorum]
MKKIILKTGISLAAICVSTPLFASGFALGEQSISSQGTSLAGRTSSVEDASIVYGNPAGMSRLKRQQVTLGVAILDAKSDISDASGTNRGTAIRGSNGGDMIPGFAVPMGFYLTPIDEHWTFGLGAYAPFGLAANYEDTFQGRYFGNKSTVKVVTLQPTISYAFNDRVSVGFGPTINRISGALESVLSLNPLLGEGRVKIKGDDIGYGFNVGVMAQVTDSTNVGLTYHSKVAYKLEGHTEISPGAGTNPALLSNGRYKGTLDISTPESVDFSVTQKLTDDWNLYVGSTWTRWSRIKDITVENSGVTSAGGALAPQLASTITEPQNWHDTWAAAVGTSYQLNKQWVLRTGMAVDQSPTNNLDRSPRIPTGDRTIFSIGAGWSPTEDITVDVAYSYLKEEAVSVDRSNALGQRYRAKYENSATGLGLGLTYRF